MLWVCRYHLVTREGHFLERDLEPAALAENVSVDGKSFRVSSWNPKAQGLNSLPDKIGVEIDLFCFCLYFQKGFEGK